MLVRGGDRGERGEGRKMKEGEIEKEELREELKEGKKEKKAEGWSSRENDREVVKERETEKKKGSSDNEGKDRYFEKVIITPTAPYSPAPTNHYSAHSCDFKLQRKARQLT